VIRAEREAPISWQSSTDPPSTMTNLVGVLMKPLQTAVARGPQYRAALFLLTEAPIFRSRPKSWVERYLPATGGIDFPTLLARGDWSTGERLVVNVAASVFGCRPDGGNTVAVNLLDIRAGLDKANRRAVFTAIEMALSHRGPGSLTEPIR
jgi:hypothetical protein